MKHKLLFGGAAVALLTLMFVTTLVALEEAPSAEPAPAAASSDPLLRVLVQKGVITADEARFLGVGTAADRRDKLVLLLKEKGLLSTAEVDELRASAASPATPAVQPATLTAAQTIAQKPTEPSKPAPPKFIPAVAPLRVLQVDPPKRDGLIPDIKVGTGARIKLYGIIKASSIYDSSSPNGTDMPLPGFIPNNANSPVFDTGPTAGREYHVKARFARIGANFEWPDVSDRWTLTGKLEFDFEGNFTRALNRNISTIRSSQASIRLAWGRIDYKATEHTSWYALFGQDWTPFGSSTLPNLIETTGLGLGFGTLYERAPQMRTGVVFNLGGERKLTFNPEFAIVMPSFGLTPTNVADQLGFGERQGADSGRPELQGRFVTQWQLDRAQGVAPAQFIISFVQGRRTAVVRAADVPLCAVGCATPNDFRIRYPQGVEIDTNRWGYTGELQLPTRFVTVLFKYWNGADLRWYFVGNLLSNYNDVTGFTSAFAGSAIDGSAVWFGLQNGVPSVVPQRAVRAQGAFVDLGFPLSRILGADPAGRNAGWQLYLHYAYDQAKASDARRTAAALSTITPGTFTAFGNRGNKNDVGAATLLWKMNTFLTFGYEQSYYRTRLAGGAVPWELRDPNPIITTGWGTWMGKQARSWHDLRSEFSTIFTF